MTPAVRGTLRRVMMVCLCHGVSERRIRREMEHGATTIEELAARCGAGSCCHGCHPTLDALLAEPAVAVANPRSQLRLA
jgi:bacterioferritin-associated ferredoxin